MSQLVKIAALVVVVVGAGAFTWLISQRILSPERDAAVQLTPVPPITGTQAGDPLPPEHEGLRDYYELKQYEQAASQPGSESFIPDMRPLAPVGQETLQDHPRWSAPNTDSPKTEPQGPSEREQRLRDAKLGAFGQLATKWSGYTGHHLIVYETPDDGAGSDPSSESLHTALRVSLTGKVHPATLLVGINSDIASPVVATLLRPPLAGATLIGRFTRANAGVLIEFSRLHIQGQSYAIEAYAVDLDTATANVASHVNRRTFSRWAAVLGSALLGGLQRGVLADSDVVTPGFGTVVVERDLDSKDIAAIAIGEIGRRTRPMAERYWNRPPTITVDEAVGVVFLSDVATVVTADHTSPDRPPEAHDPRAAAALRRYLEERLSGNTRPTGQPYRTEPTRLNGASLDAALQEDQSDGAGY